MTCVVEPAGPVCAHWRKQFRLHRGVGSSRETRGSPYGGGAGTLGGAVGSAMAVGGKRGMSAIAWHPDNVRVERLN